MKKKIKAWAFLWDDNGKKQIVFDNHDEATIYKTKPKPISSPFNFPWEDNKWEASEIKIIIK